MDVDALRAETPGCDQRLHFDNAGASPPPDPVHTAVLEHLELERRIGGYAAARDAAPRIEHFYASFAQLLGCKTEEIAYVENATRAWDMAFYGIPFQDGDRILTGHAEYSSNFLAFLQMARRRNVHIDIVPDTADGEMDVEALESMIDERVRLIALTHVPSQNGLVSPAAAVGEVARRHGILYLLDACQSVGQMPVDVNVIGCDMLSGTGRKFLRGPRGTGFLYVRTDAMEQLDPPFIDLHAAVWTDERSYELRPDARRFECWESHVAGRIGLGVAASYAMSVGLADIGQRVSGLAGELRRRLKDLPGIEVRDPGRERCGIVTFTSVHETATALRDRLEPALINVSTSTSPYARLDLGRRGIPEVVRASLHYFNTESEIDRFCDTLTT